MSPPSRSKLIASGVFFVLYLAIQTVYPALAWVLPGYEHFTWAMYSGRPERPQFSVVMGDRTRRRIGNPLRRDATVRLLGSQVDQARFVPPYLCAAWIGTRAVEVRFTRSGRVDVIACPAR